MLTLTTSQAAHLLALSVATVKRFSLSGKLACTREPNGARTFELESIADFYLDGPAAQIVAAASGAPADAFAAVLERGSTDACVLWIVQRVLNGATLARVFDEILPSVARAPRASLEFIERMSPVAPTCAEPSRAAMVLGSSADSPRVRMAASLLRGCGFEVPSLTHASLEQPTPLVACLSPALVVAIAPHRDAAALLHEELRATIGGCDGRLLVEGAGGDFVSLEQLFALACVRTPAQPTQIGRSQRNSHDQGMGEST